MVPFPLFLCLCRSNCCFRLNGFTVKDFAATKRKPFFNGWTWNNFVPPFSVPTWCWRSWKREWLAMTLVLFFILSVCAVNCSCFRVWESDLWGQDQTWKYHPIAVACNLNVITSFWISNQPTFSWSNHFLLLLAFLLLHIHTELIHHFGKWPKCQTFFGATFLSWKPAWK